MTPEDFKNLLENGLGRNGEIAVTREFLSDVFPQRYSAVARYPINNPIEDIQKFADGNGFKVEYDSEKETYLFTK